jgi:hypothetical protein
MVKTAVTVVLALGGLVTFAVWALATTNLTCVPSDVRLDSAPLAAVLLAAAAVAITLVQLRRGATAGKVVLLGLTTMECAALSVAAVAAVVCFPGGV